MAKTTLRIPDELYQRITQSAEQGRRSINQQIIWLLERALGSDEQR